MELLDVIRARRSVKRFDPGHRLTEDELRRLLKHTVLAPTSFNMQNWHFVVCTEQRVQDALCEASWNQRQVAECSATMVLCGDLEAHARTTRYLRNVPEAARAKLEPMILGLYDGKEALLRDEACRTAGLAGMAMMLVAKDMGLDSCPMIGFDPVKVSDALALPPTHPPLMMITVGKALEPPRPRMGLLNLEEVVSMNRFGAHALHGVVDED